MWEHVVVKSDLFPTSKDKNINLYLECLFLIPLCDSRNIVITKWHIGKQLE